MTSTQQRAALQRQIWQIANEVRGAMDGWDFKQYVLGTLFYRFISENFAAYFERPSMRGISRIFGVSRNTLSKWLKKIPFKRRNRGYLITV